MKETDSGARRKGEREKEREERRNVNVFSYTYVCKVNVCVCVCVYTCASGRESAHTYVRGARVLMYRIKYTIHYSF